MNVIEAAQELGVSPRRVRALIESGRITAHKAGRGWEVTDLGSGTRRRRPLSVRSREMLALALRNRTLGGLTGQDRARTAARLRELRTSADAAQTLIDWWGASSPASAGFAESLVQQALSGNHDGVNEALRRRRREYLRLREDLADVVDTERTIRGMRQRELADAAGVAVELVRRIERAEPVDSPAGIRRVLRAIDVEPTALPDTEIA